MIKLIIRNLPAAAQQKLREWQKAITDEPDFAQRVALGKTQFSSRNNPDNATFRAVRETLVLMCAGARRCNYCEDSVADEVEHLWPKDLYPELVFAWLNYLYACGACNLRKNNKFAVFETATGQLLVVRRPTGAPVVSPPAGKPVFLDPRKDDGLAMLDLDLQTGIFLPAGTAATKKFQRAKFTIDTLDLNREPLPTARTGAYRHYRGQLRDYVALRAAGAPVNEMNDLINFVKGMEHPTVWAEMKRQRAFIPRLTELFTQAPEALNW